MLATHSCKALATHLWVATHGLRNATLESRYLRILASGKTLHEKAFHSEKIVTFSLTWKLRSSGKALQINTSTMI